MVYHYCLLVSLLAQFFSQWEQLNGLSLLWAIKYLLNSTAWVNISSQWEQLNGLSLV